MSSLVCRSRRRLYGYALCGFAFCLLALVSGPSTSAVDMALPEPVTSVQEDWVLVLNEPNGAVDSPQFHTVMTPFDNAESYFAQVSWNYRETPDFVTGGVQLQSYYGESLIRRRSMEFGQLSNTAETVTWTQTLTTDGMQLSFHVTNGQSTTWGTFGKDMTITADAGLADLNGYSPDTSAQESCVTYGSNRVNSLTISQVRYYGASGLLAVDNTPRVVFQLETNYQ